MHEEDRRDTRYGNVGEPRCPLRVLKRPCHSCEPLGSCGDGGDPSPRADAVGDDSVYSGGFLRKSSRHRAGPTPSILRVCPEKAAATARSICRPSPVPTIRSSPETAAEIAVSKNKTP